MTLIRVPLRIIGSCLTLQAITNLLTLLREALGATAPRPAVTQFPIGVRSKLRRRVTLKLCCETIFIRALAVLIIDSFERLQCSKTCRVLLTAALG